MTAQPTPEHTQAMTIRVMLGVAALLFLLFAGIAVWSLWSSYQHTKSWTPSEATIESLETLCSVEQKRNKNWHVEETAIACDEAARLVKERDSLLSNWRVSKTTYAEITYAAGGEQRRQKLPVTMIADETALPGSRYHIYVDPADPMRLDKPFGQGQINSFLAMLGIGAAIAGFTMLVGWLVAKANRKKAETRLALAQAAPADAAAPAMAAAVAMPLWAKLTRWLGIVILVGGMLLGALAIIAALYDGNTGAASGGVGVMAISVGIWRVLAFVANRGRTSTS